MDLFYGEYKEISPAVKQSLQECKQAVEKFVDIIKKDESTEQQIEESVDIVDTHVCNIWKSSNYSWSEKFYLGKEVGHTVIKSGALDWLCKTFVGSREVYPQLSGVATLSSNIIGNLAWFSRSLAKRAHKYPGFLDFENYILENELQRTKKLKVADQTISDTATKVLQNVLITLQNSCYSSAYVLKKIRKTKTFDMLKQFMVVTDAKKDTFTRFLILQIMAQLMDERENFDTLHDMDDVIRSAMHLLSFAIDEESRTCMGIATWESATVLRQLSTMDANKVLLIDLGLLDIFVRLSKLEEDIDQYEVATTFFHLSLYEESRKRMTKDKRRDILQALVDLVKLSKNDRVVQAATGALLELKQDLYHNDMFTNVIENLFRKKSKGHVMISYSREQREILLQVKSCLEGENYDVWMDVSNMSGDVYDKMAHAVENAAVVLIGVSRSYKRSAYCQKEAKYADGTLQRTVFPLKLETDYNGDGWLGLMTAGKFYYDFANKPFEKTIKKLIEDLELIAYKTTDAVSSEQKGLSFQEPHGISVVDGPVTTSSMQSFSHGMPLVNNSRHNLIISRNQLFEKFKQISEEDLKRWKSKHHISNEAFSEFRPLDIVTLAEMIQMAPDAYWTQLTKLLKQFKKVERFKLMADFTEAIKDLQI